MSRFHVTGKFEWEEERLYECGITCDEFVMAESAEDAIERLRKQIDIHWPDYESEIQTTDRRRIVTRLSSVALVDSDDPAVIEQEAERAAQDEAKRNLEYMRRHSSPLFTLEEATPAGSGPAGV